MLGKRSLYRGKQNLDYENPFSDGQESQKRIKEHMRQVKGRSGAEKEQNYNMEKGIKRKRKNTVRKEKNML
ncbi:MAG: hypothetical protein K2M46_00115 [Lachnospiraceae bacterium]|nr:hypothetical protein [Lachnospiraceae bacterium]